jgi:hypothetical protein
MATRLEEVRQVDDILTTLAQGYSNNMYIGDHLFKNSFVVKESAKYQLYGKEQFYDYGSQIIRPLRANPKEKDSHPPTLDNYSCEAYSLAGTVDQREIDEASPLQNLLNDGVDEIMSNLKVTKEKIRADLVTDVNQYDASHKATPVTKWDNNTNIASEIENYKDVVRSAIGRNPNVIVMGPTVWNGAFKFNSTLSEKIKYSEKDVLTTELIAQILEVDKLMVGYSSFVDPETMLQSYIWGNSLVLAYVEPRDGKNIPTFARTFQKKGYPNVKRWVDGADFHKYRVEDIFDNKITGKDAGFLVSEPVA